METFAPNVSNQMRDCAGYDIDVNVGDRFSDSEVLVSYSGQESAKIRHGRYADKNHVIWALHLNEGEVQNEIHYVNSKMRFHTDRNLAYTINQGIENIVREGADIYDDCIDFGIMESDAAHNAHSWSFLLMMSYYKPSMPGIIVMSERDINEFRDGGSESLWSVMVLSSQTELNYIEPNIKQDFCYK